MDTGPAELAVQQYNAQGLQDVRRELLAVFSDVYAEELDDPFFSVDRFWNRLEGYARGKGFGLATGRIDGELVGYTLGYTLAAESRWWRGFKGDVDPDLLVETDTRTFAINELMVQSHWRRRGYATVLSRALLDKRPEERATLLVRAENTAADNAYRSWGFTTIGQVQPFDDSPLYEAMVCDLPIRATT